jgi:hypothetical protein
MISHDTEEGELTNCINSWWESELAQSLYENIMDDSLETKNRTTM